MILFVWVGVTKACGCTWRGKAFATNSTYDGLLLLQAETLSQAPAQGGQSSPMQADTGKAVPASSMRLLRVGAAAPWVPIPSTAGSLAATSSAASALLASQQGLQITPVAVGNTTLVLESVLTTGGLKETLRRCALLHTNEHT